MNKKMLLFVHTIISISFLTIGCQKKTNKVILPDLNFAMTLPSGWVIDSKDSATYYDKNKPDDNFGWVADFQLEPNELLNGFIDSLLSEEQAMFKEQKEILKMFGEEIDENEFIERKVISRENKNISGFEAVLMISEAEYSVMELFIKKENSVIIVSFRTSKDDFSEYEPIFIKAIETIILK